MTNNFPAQPILWLLLSLSCVLLILFGLYKVLHKTDWPSLKKKKIFAGTAICIFLWSALLCLLAYKGFFADFSKFPPRPALVLVVTLPVVLYIAFSKTGTALLQMVPPQWLVFIQSFRIMVELLLWSAFLSGQLPVQMTFEGGNFDVLTGILALPAGYILLRRKPIAHKLAVTFNIIGLLLLLNILIIAVLSMPTPIRHFMNEPANILVTGFPYILLPGLLVPIAYTFHIFSLRQLLTKK